MWYSDTISGGIFFSQACIFREIFGIWFIKMVQPLLLNKWLGKASCVHSFWVLEIIVDVSLQTLLLLPFPWKGNWKFLTQMESKKANFVQSQNICSCFQLFTLFLLAAYIFLLDLCDVPRLLQLRTETENYFKEIVLNCCFFLLINTV